MMQGMGEKLTLLLHHLTTFIAGVIIGFVHSWQLTLVIFAMMPLLVVIAGTIFSVVSKFDRKGQNEYARAGDAANETLSSIRTVAAYGGEVRYENLITTEVPMLPAARKPRCLVMTNSWRVRNRRASARAILWVWQWGPCS